MEHVSQPNILYIMCDQFRADAIAALGNPLIKTPHLDRLVQRGVSMTNAYSTCPVCVPARYTIRTGREPHTTCIHSNSAGPVPDELDADMQKRCGEYLAHAMSRRGYTTFGIGKFHTVPAFEQTGFDVQLNTEELWDSLQKRQQDAYAGFLMANHPEYRHIEQPHGERTEMYYMPQASPFPPELTVEGYVTRLALEQLDLAQKGDKPFFGFVSFIGPHPPCAPPIPYNRMYNPDDMPDPVKGSPEHDHADEQIPFMNHLIWADGLNDFSARAIRSRYYGEISYIDACIGQLLDKIDAMPGADDTLICFFADHGDHMGDHHAWQKESYFEQSTRIPFLISWPAVLPRGARSQELACLTDLFGIATSAAGQPEFRDGTDLLSVLAGKPGREKLLATYGQPGTREFKFMVRYRNWKYIWMANGGRRQLFNLELDPDELDNSAQNEPELITELHAWAEAEADRPGLKAALDQQGFLVFPFYARPLRRINQMAADLGINEFG